MRFAQGCLRILPKHEVSGFSPHAVMIFGNPGRVIG